jgi:hypothetical protein
VRGQQQEAAEVADPAIRQSPVCGLMTLTTLQQTRLIPTVMDGICMDPRFMALSVTVNGVPTVVVVVETVRLPVKSPSAATAVEAEPINPTTANAATKARRAVRERIRCHTGTIPRIAFLVMARSP